MIVKKKTKEQQFEIANKILDTKNYLNASIENILAMLSIARLKNYSVDQYVFHEGETVEAFYILISGQIEINKLNDKDNERILSVLNSGDVFCIGEVFKEKHGITAKCLKNTEIGYIKKEDFIQKICDIKPLYLDFMHMMSSIISFYQRGVVLENAEKKIIAYLNWLKKEYGYKKDGVLCIKRTLSNSKIAGILSVSREYVSKVLNLLQKEKIIEMNNENFIIHDPVELEARASHLDELVVGYYGTYNSDY